MLPPGIAKNPEVPELRGVVLIVASSRIPEHQSSCQGPFSATPGV